MLLSSRSRRLLAVLILGSATLPAFAEGLPGDVLPSNWATPAVQNLVDKWHILGLSPTGTFNGSQEVSRYEAAETMWRVARTVEKHQGVDLTITTTATHAYGDIEAQHESAIEAVTNKYGFTDGLPGDHAHRFDGHRSISRFELAWLLHRLMLRADERQIAVTGKGPVLIYKDLPEAHWGAKPVSDLTRRFGLLIGYPDGYFRGDRALTRFELATAMNAALQNLLEKQFMAPPLKPPVTVTVTPPDPVVVVSKPPLPGFELDLALRGGRHEGRDVIGAGAVDLGWWYGDVGGTRPGLGITGDYALLMNRAQIALVQGAAANVELRWRFAGTQSPLDPYFYLATGYHGDLWHTGTPAVFHAHGIGYTVAGGLPTNVWDLWLYGRITGATYLFPDLSGPQRLASSQTYMVGLEKKWGNYGLRLGYGGTMFERYPTGNDGVFLPANSGGLQMSSHWAF